MAPPGGAAETAGRFLATRRFGELTSPEVEEALARRCPILVPLGSTEQHGPHLPTATDYLASLAIADRVADRIDGLVLAGLAFGVTPAHMGFAGTVSLAGSTFEAVLREIVASIASHGARDVALINWHEGNLNAVGSTASRLTHELALNVVVVHACYVAEQLFGEELGGLTHGGAIEAAAVLGDRPDLVHLERLPAEEERDGRGQAFGGEREADGARRGRAFQSVLRDIREVSDVGWYGRPRQADGPAGKRLLEDVAAAVADELEARFARMHSLRHTQR